MDNAGIDTNASWCIMLPMQACSLQPERYNGANSPPKIASKHKIHSDGAMPYCEGRRKSLPAHISGRYTALATYKDEIHIFLFALNHDENVEK